MPALRWRICDATERARQCHAAGAAADIILIARACWRAYTRHSTDEYLHIVYLNDSLERIRNVVIHEIISWGSI